jgi:hypothetical protein
MCHNPIIANTLEVGELVSRFDTLNTLLANSYDKYIFFAAAGSLIATSIAIIISSIFATKQTAMQKQSLEKLSEQVSVQNNQLQLQTSQWKNEFIIREYQKNIIEFRRVFIDFSNNMMELISIIVPPGLKAKNFNPLPSFDELQSMPSNNLEDDSDVICFYDKIFYTISPSELLSKYKKSYKEFSDFIEVNGIFIDENEDIYSDMLSLKRAFGFFIEDYRIEELFSKSFIYIDADKKYMIRKNTEIRYFFFMLVLRELQITREVIDANGRKDKCVSCILHHCCPAKSA